MTVSFLIPLYNCLPLTQAMLASLQATLPVGLEHEIILVDDGSTDGTRDWLKTLEGKTPFRVVLNERNLGYAGANNRAAAVATGEFLFLLNNDLILTTRWLEPMLGVHAALSRDGIVGNIQRSIATGLVDHAGFFIDHRGKPEHQRQHFPLISRQRPVIAVTGACLLVKRALWERLQGFDERFVNGGEDVDFCLRAQRAGHPVVVAQRSIIHHHVSASPGRNRRNEQNSRRLISLWRRNLSQAASRSWCLEYALTQMDAASTFAEPLETLQIALHALGFPTRPPAAALRAIADNLDDEFSRWRALGVA